MSLAKTIKSGGEGRALRGKRFLGWKNGWMVKFWMDRSCGDESLGKAFPILLLITTTKDQWVVGVWG